MATTKTKEEYMVSARFEGTVTNICIYNESRPISGAQRSTRLCIHNSRAYDQIVHVRPLLHSTKLVLFFRIHLVSRVIISPTRGNGEFK